MTHEDAERVHELAVAAFGDLNRRLGHPPYAPPPGPALIRLEHLVRTDPGGAFVAEAGGELIGAALALVREGLWGLSLLVVAPAHQSAGTGRALLAAALAYAEPEQRGGVILASQDPRALRAYARAGFAPHPCLDAAGRPRGVTWPEGVREGGPQDLALTESVDRAVRGAAHGDDLLAALAAGQRMLVDEGRGYALLKGATVGLLAALDEASAQRLLRAALAAVAPGEDAAVEWITAKQAWAIEPVMEAGLDLSPGGAVFVRGDVGPFSPYLPSGAYL